MRLVVVVLWGDEREGRGVGEGERRISNREKKKRE